MVGHESKSYGTIARILEASLNQPLDLAQIERRAGLNYKEARLYLEYLFDLELLESMKLPKGLDAFSDSSTQIYWTSTKGKILLAHLEALKQLVNPGESGLHKRFAEMKQMFSLKKLCWQ